MQLALAGRLGRPVSVHCVRAAGTVLEAVDTLAVNRCAPPVVAMHSYGGAPELIPPFLALCKKGVDVYFGFSLSVNGRDDRSVSHMRACLAVVPPDR